MASEKIGDATSEREMYELKQAAVKYYTENGVTDRMEEILNSMFFTNPDDVYGHISNYFASHSKTPTICKVTGNQAFDSKGEPALQVNVYGTVKNVDKTLSSTTVSNKTQLTDAWKIEDKEAEDTNRQESVAEAVSYVNDQIAAKLSGVDPLDQSGVDEVTYDFIEQIRQEKEDETARENAASALTAEETPQSNSPTKKAKSPKGKKSAAPVPITPDPPAEVSVHGCELVAAVSMAVCQAAAGICDVPLYEHIAGLRGEEPAEKLRLPFPVVTILQGGKSSPGKQNCVKEFMVTTCPGTPLTEGLQKIRAIQAMVFKTLFTKAGNTLRSISETGAITPLLDRPEQGLDIIQDAATHLEYTAGTDYNIILHLGGKDIFDYEKGRYEVMTGQMKLADELADFYADLVTRYPSVIGIIDPIRAVEKEAWFKLGEKISEKCFVFDDEGHDRPGKYRNTLQFTEHFTTSGIAFKYDEMTTVTHLTECSKLLREKNQRIMLSTSVGETSDTFLADLAVGLGADFLRIGGLSRGERVNKLNRLLQIQAQLASKDRLDTNPEHEFPRVSLPEIPPTPETGQEGVASSQEVQSNVTPGRK